MLDNSLKCVTTYVYCMKIPGEINGPNSKLIYLYVGSKDSPASIEELSNNLQMSKLTIFPVVDQLCESDYLQRTEEGIVIQS